MIRLGNKIVYHIWQKTKIAKTHQYLFPIHLSIIKSTVHFYRVLFLFLQKFKFSWLYTFRRWKNELIAREIEMKYLNLNFVEFFYSTFNIISQLLTYSCRLMVRSTMQCYCRITTRKQYNRWVKTEGCVHKINNTENAFCHLGFRRIPLPWLIAVHFDTHSLEGFSMSVYVEVFISPRFAKAILTSFKTNQ